MTDTPRQTFAVGETIRQRHLDAVDAMSDEIASLRAALTEIAHETRRQQLPITALVHDLARQALKDTPDAE